MSILGISHLSVDSQRPPELDSSLRALGYSITFSQDFATPEVKRQILRQPSSERFQMALYQNATDRGPAFEVLRHCTDTHSSKPPNRSAPPRLLPVVSTPRSQQDPELDPRTQPLTLSLHSSKTGQSTVEQLCLVPARFDNEVEFACTLPGDSSSPQVVDCLVFSTNAAACRSFMRQVLTKQPHDSGECLLDDEHHFSYERYLVRHPLLTKRACQMSLFFDRDSSDDDPVYLDDPGWTSLCLITADLEKSLAMARKSDYPVVALEPMQIPTVWAGRQQSIAYSFVQLPGTPLFEFIEVRMR
jgi:hypothetical protein